MQGIIFKVGAAPFINGHPNFKLKVGAAPFINGTDLKLGHNKLMSKANGPPYWKFVAFDIKPA